MWVCCGRWRRGRARANHRGHGGVRREHGESRWEGAGYAWGNAGSSAAIRVVWADRVVGYPVEQRARFRLTG